MALRLTLLFLLVIAVAVFLQVIFYSSSQISCESDTISNRYAECFCISNPQNLRAFNDKDSLRFYGWVQFFVLLQAILLYIPYRVGTQLDIAKPNLTLPSRYILEIPVIMTLIGVIWMSDKILGGNFLLLGIKVITNACSYYSPQPPPPPPLVQIFPMMATCKVESYNSNSTYSASCYLPMNELNSYAFLALWLIYFTSMACSLCTLTIVVGKIIKNALTRQRPKANGDSLAEDLLANEEPVGSEDCLPNKKYNRLLNLIVKPVTYDRVFQKV